MTGSDYGHFGALSETLNHIRPATPEERHSAALTVAERALAEHWSLDVLGRVLDALGLGAG